MYQEIPPTTMTIFRLRGKARHEITALPLSNILDLMEGARGVGLENVFLEIGADRVINLGDIEEIIEGEVVGIEPGSN